MNDPTRLRIDIDVIEDDLKIEVWAMVEKTETGSSWKRIVSENIPAPKEKEQNAI
jgi:hypothetical protein